MQYVYTPTRIYTFTHHPCIHQVWDGGLQYSGIHLCTYNTAGYIPLFLVFIHLHIIRVSIRCGMEVLFCRNTSHYFQKRYKVAGVLRSAQAQVVHPNLHPQPCIPNPTTQTLKLVWRGRHWHEYQDKLIATLNH